jgi:hypothetical protein
MPKRHIILLGHRKQHGKDTVANIFQMLLPEKVKRTMFAKRLKQQCAERYNLDLARMEDNDYKESRPEHLGGKSVRQVLIEEGCFGRSIWLPVWASGAYKEIFESSRPIGLITDYRFPNEYSDFEEICRVNGEDPSNYVLHRILVNRPEGRFDDDGADAELPDSDSQCWDYAITNPETDDWIIQLQMQVSSFIVERLGD